MNICDHQFYQRRLSNTASISGVSSYRNLYPMKLVLEMDKVSHRGRWRRGWVNWWCRAHRRRWKVPSLPTRRWQPKILAGLAENMLTPLLFLVGKEVGPKSKRTRRWPNPSTQPFLPFPYCYIWCGKKCSEQWTVRRDGQKGEKTDCAHAHSNTSKFTTNFCAYSCTVQT